ncbi:hypothetical protein CA54_22220 [Symmachiella macrocystis]|uniref:Uncharacterized protein n=1 Tax=Symmachiella macrocystis TaxID=2527985 RepID=A0A5C6BNR0_9PLAN|nr:hypothetical protein [Symmachiella macrocystis]TWU13387.1 hypothetical protein CA54_22220 [Symmachiella macrocystis]
MTHIDGLTLEVSDGRDVPATLDGVNAVLRDIGAGVWPLDLSEVEKDIRTLLSKRNLDEAEAAHVKKHFLLSMDRLLEITAAAGREPQVPGGGSSETKVTNHGYSYPQLYVVGEGIDYSRFDRFHINIGADGAGVDEVFQMLAGGPFVIHQRLDDGESLIVTLNCPTPGHGWLGTYSGIRPHIGSVGSAAVGSKFLVQAFGAPQWNLTYVDLGD